MTALRAAAPLYLAAATVAASRGPRGWSGSFEAALTAVERAAPAEWQTLPEWPADADALAAALDVGADRLASLGVLAVVRHRGRRIALIAAVAWRQRPVTAPAPGSASSAVARLKAALAGLPAAPRAICGAAARMPRPPRATAAAAVEESRMSLSGMSPAEIAKARQEAADLAAQMPSVGMNEILHEARNARAVVGSSAEAAPLMSALVRLRTIAQAQKPGKDVTDDLDKLVKGLEIKGVTQDPKKFVEYMNGVAKGLSVFGDTLSASQYYQMFLYGRQATPRLSEEFVLGTAPTLAQELRGSSYGRAVAAFNKAVVGGTMTGHAAKELQRIGLIGATDLDKAGALKSGRSVHGWELAQTDPNAWVRQYLLPAMDAHGIKGDAAIAKEIGQTFGNQMAAQMVTLLATQQSKIDKDNALIRGAKGLEGADYALRNDPEIAFHALRESLGNLGATLGEGTARALAPVASDLAKAIARFSAQVERNNQFLQAHPGEETPANKAARRSFNRAVFGVDTEKGVADITPDEWLEADFAKRRAMLLKWRRERETDPERLAHIAERRKHVAPGFEASSAAQDDADEFPMRATADRQLAALDAEIKAYRARRAAMQAEIDRLRGAQRFANRPAPDAPYSPTIATDPTDAPLGTVLFPTSRRMGYGRADITTPARPSVPPPPPPPPPRPVDVTITGKVTADPLVVHVEASPELKATARGMVGLRAAMVDIRKSGSASVGKSLPEASPNGANGSEH